MHTLTVDGTEVHIDGQGDETLVMLHGWPDTWHLWDAQVAALQDRYRCVRFTWPGFDASQPRRARSLDELVAHLDQILQAVSPDRPVTLLLHDWGCAFGYRYYQCHPQRVRRIIGVDIGDAGSSAHMAEINLRAKLMIAGYQLWLALAWALGPRMGDPMTRLMARALGCRSEPQRIASRMNYPYWIQWTGQHGSYRALRPLRPDCPMLYLYGRKKPFLFHSNAWAEQLAAQPGSQVMGFDTGHWVMVQQPQAFNTAVRDWLEK